MHDDQIHQTLQQHHLDHIEQLDKNNQFAELVNYVLNIENYHQFPLILNELARAYNNLYWQNKIPENLHYLQQAVDILHSIAYLQDDEEHASAWHYHIGYAYYFLEDLTQAQYHLNQVEDIVHSGDLLRQIDWMQRHQISAVEASVGHTHYLLKDLRDHFIQYCPDVYQSLQPALDLATIQSFAKNHNVDLPNGFVQLYESFNGQKQQDVLAKYGHFNYFVPLEQIEILQQQWQQQLRDFFGENWEKITLTEQQCPSHEWVKAQLFNPKWLPILVNDFGYICVDLDPIYSEDYGQIIHVSIAEDLQDCGVFYQCASIQDCLHDVLLSLQYFQDTQEEQFNDHFMDTTTILPS
ncbi:MULTISPECIES: SMI1/KNR4 family protein [unclassified Acinetobacter]|uniref:SMI1/KNR4 family protein n=1 Tax=unclassified Acinetobacter TaxID=196816 RepID=UPI0035BB6F25